MGAVLDHSCRLANFVCFLPICPYSCCVVGPCAGYVSYGRFYLCWALLGGSLICGSLPAWLKFRTQRLLRKTWTLRGETAENVTTAHLSGHDAPNGKPILISAFISESHDPQPTKNTSSDDVDRTSFSAALAAEAAIGSGKAANESFRIIRSKPTQLRRPSQNNESGSQNMVYKYKVSVAVNDSLLCFLEC